MERKCPLCSFKSYDLEQIKKHLVECGIDAMEKKFECKYDNCNYASNKKANLNRHAKRHVKESEDTVMNVSDSEPEKVDSDYEWKEQDPGDLLGPISSSEEEEEVDEKKNEEVKVNNNDMIDHETIKTKPSTSQIEVGRIIRKPTYPQKVLVPKRAHVSEGDKDEPPRKIGPKDLRNVIPMPVIPKRVVVQKATCMVDESTQTDPFIIKRCTIRTSTFEQDGKHVELVEKEWAEICDGMKEYKNKDKDPEGE